MENKKEPLLNTDARVYAGQVELLYSHAMIGIAASILNGAIIVIVLWKFIPHMLLIFWGCLLLVRFDRPHRGSVPISEGR